MPMIFSNPLPMKGIVNFENHVRIASHFSGRTKTLYNVDGSSLRELPLEIADDYANVLESITQQRIGSVYNDSFIIKVRNRNYPARCKVFAEDGWLIVATTEPIILGRSTIPKTYYVAFSPEDLIEHKDEIYNMLGWDSILRNQSSEESTEEEQNSSENEEQEEQTEDSRTCSNCAFNLEGYCTATRIFRNHICDINYSGHMNENDEVAIMLLQNRIPKKCTLCEMYAGSKLYMSCINCLKNNFSNYSEKQISYVQNVWEYHKKFTKL